MPTAPPVLNEPLLEAQLGRLEHARAWSPRAIAKLEALVRGADERALFRVNPLRFAAEKSLPEAEAIDLFLHATHLNLFRMNWQLLCPECADVVESFRTLKTVSSHYRCPLCQKDFEAEMDDYIEVNFTVASEVRAIGLHRPDTLPVEAYYFDYVFSPEALVKSGRRFIDAVRPGVRVLNELAPGERKGFRFAASPGLLEGCDRMNHAGLRIDVRGTPADQPQAVSAVLHRGRFEPDTIILAPGEVALEVENRTGRRGSLFLLQLGPDYTPARVLYEPHLSGKRLVTTQTFRDLFYGEVIEGRGGLSVRAVTILFTGLKGSTVLYDRIGDLKALALIKQHFESLRGIIQGEGGAVVKTIGDAVMASFAVPDGAVRAALAMQREVRRFNDEQGGREIRLKIGLHAGAALVVTLNDRLDYFGQTVNIASRIRDEADEGEICLTREAHDFPGVPALLDGASPGHSAGAGRGAAVSLSRAALRGVEDEVEVFRVMVQ